MTRVKRFWQTTYLSQRRSNIRTGSTAYFWLIGFLVNFLCIVAPPVGTRSWRVRFVFFYRTSYVGSTSRQHLATVIRYANCVKQRFRPSGRRLVANYTSFITRLLWLCLSEACVNNFNGEKKGNTSRCIHNDVMAGFKSIFSPSKLVPQCHQIWGRRKNTFSRIHDVIIDYTS